MTRAHPYTLSAPERLKSRKLIEGLFREGRSFSLFPFRAYYAPFGAVKEWAAIAATNAENSPGPPQAGKVGDGGLAFPVLQAGFGVSSKYFKRAVDRNRIKRLTREAYRLQKQDLSGRLGEQGKNLALFIVYTGKEIPDQSLMMEKMGLVLQRLEKEIS